jgi:hypothetical protein
MPLGAVNTVSNISILSFSMHIQAIGNKSKAIDVAIALLASDEKLWSELAFKVKEKL